MSSENVGTPLPSTRAAAVRPGTSKGLAPVRDVLANAREKLWTPEKEKGGTGMKIWTPGSEEKR